MDTRKQAIIAALDKWIRQRPGLEFGNYGEVAPYRAELRQIARDLHAARTLLRAVEWRESITADDLIHAAEHAFSGRLTIKDISAHYNDGSTYHVFSIDYCTGQYWPTEYRKAVAAVLAYALWDWMRDKCMPSAIIKNGEKFYPHVGGKGNVQSAGSWLRDTFRREFGRGLQQRYFS